MEIKRTTQPPDPSNNDLAQSLLLIEKLLRKLPMSADEHDAVKVSLGLLGHLAQEGLAARIGKMNEAVTQSKADGEVVKRESESSEEKPQEGGASQ